ncbi:hypothetical protein GTZ99_02415 [Novosphingobium sp. FSY-8]|uniref:Methyl-accepting chemotaxis protein n=1 Tax=Novosphingobium ovatum TaxID=1908523 RepID=A0ABW9XA56_9SPHN|nr:hypothetical protein [Novosphingobium ovatum]NBC35406.1 hypothetical protein [Novosphingobium ovatum]
MASLPLPYTAFDDEPQLALGDARTQLAQIAAGLDQRFVHSGEALARSVDSIRTLLSGLEETAEALSPTQAGAAVSHLRNAAEQLAQMPTALRARDADLGRVATISTQLRGQVADIQKMLVMLGIYGMNIKIAGAGGNFRIFVDDMSSRLKIGEAELSQFAKRLSAITASVAQVRKVDANLLASQSSGSDGVPVHIQRCADRLGAHVERVSGSAAALMRITRDVEMAVGGVLTAIQVADSTRQRIEHAVGAIDVLRGAPAGMASAARVAALISAQIAMAGRDYTEQARQLTGSLERLTRTSADLAQLARSGAGLTKGAEGGEALRDLEGRIVDIDRMTGDLRASVARSGEMAQCIGEGIEDLRLRLESIDQIVRDVKEIAINTRLLCRREREAGQAVAVIAVEVAQQAKVLQEIANNIDGAIAEFGMLNDHLRLRDETSLNTDLGVVLAEALQVVRAAVERGNQSMDAQGARTRALLEELDVATDGVAQDLSLGGQLAQLSQAIDAAPAALDQDGACDWLRQALTRISALYTMAAEREVHARFCPPGMGLAAPVLASKWAPANATAADEDGLFDSNDADADTDEDGLF